MFSLGCNCTVLGAVAGETMSAPSLQSPSCVVTFHLTFRSCVSINPRIAQNPKYGTKKWCWKTAPPGQTSQTRLQGFHAVMRGLFTRDQFADQWFSGYSLICVWMFSVQGFFPFKEPVFPTVTASTVCSKSVIQTCSTCKVPPPPPIILVITRLYK